MTDGEAKTVPSSPPMTALQRAAARVRCEAATAGPFVCELGELLGLRNCSRHMRWLAYDSPWHTGYRGSPQADADGEFFAHARTDLPLALSEIDRLEALLCRHGIDPLEDVSHV